MGFSSVAGAVWEVLMEWGVRTRWLDSRLACDGPRGRRVRVGVGSKLEVGVLVVERNFAEFSGEFARDYFGKRHGPSAQLGSHGKAALEGSGAVSSAHPRPECRMDLPGPTTSVGTRTDYSVGPWDYPACATRHLKAWSTRTTQE